MPRWRQPAREISSRLAEFFFARHRPFQAAAMNGDAELLLYGLDAFDGSQARRGSLQVPDVLDYFVGQLVPLLGAALLGQQARQATASECDLCLIEGWARDTEYRGDIDDRSAFDAVAPQHLVAHLQQVFGVEERALAEQSVGDGGGGRVEGAGAFELHQFLIGLFAFGHALPGRIVCKYYYASYTCLSRTIVRGICLGIGNNIAQ